MGIMKLERLHKHLHSPHCTACPSGKEIFPALGRPQWSWQLRAPNRTLNVRCCTLQTLSRPNARLDRWLFLSCGTAGGPAREEEPEGRAHAPCSSAGPCLHSQRAVRPGRSERWQHLAFLMRRGHLCCLCAACAPCAASSTCHQRLHASA